MPPNTQPWAPYIVGNPSTRSNWTEPDCQPFSDIFHVAHIDHAISIVKQSRIVPGLIQDKSVLNDERILVNWLSPNTWANGYRYGSVAFKFDLQSLIEGKNIYWVEAIDYKVPAPRILITSIDRSADSKLVPFDPREKTGPWWFDDSNDVHYRNGNFTLEFMIEEALDINEATSVSFVDHHADYCCIDSISCPDKKRRADSAAGFFAAGIGLFGLDCKILSFDGHALDLIQRAFLKIYHKSKDASFSGQPLNQDTESALARAWLGACYFRRKPEEESLRAIFTSRDSFFTAISTLLNDSFGATNLPALQDPENADY